MPSKTQPKIFVRKSGLSPYAPLQRSSLRESVSAQHDTENGTSDEECSPGLVPGQRKRQNPPSPVLGHTSPPRKRLALGSSAQASVSSPERPPTNRTLSCPSEPLSFSDIHAVANPLAVGDEVPASLPQVSTAHFSAPPTSASPAVSALEAEIKDLKIQLLRAKYDDLFQVKNELVRCMQKLEDAEDDNKKLKKAHEMSNISWHVIQTISPQVTSLLDGGIAKVLDLYDTKALQAQLVLRDSSKTERCIEGSESIRLGTRPDKQTSAIANDVQAALSDDADEYLVSRIQGALLSTPSSPPVVISATGHARSPTPNQSSRPSNEKKSPRILPGIIRLPSYLTSHLNLITGSQAPDTLDSAPAEPAAAESGRSRLTPFSQINAQHSAVTCRPKPTDTSISDLIAHINLLPDKIIDSLPGQSAPATTMGTTIPDSTENTPAPSPARSPEKARDPLSAPEVLHLVRTCEHLGANNNDPVATETASSITEAGAEALRVELWHLREQNRKLERRVRILLNQQSGCGF